MYVNVCKIAIENNIRLQVCKKILSFRYEKFCVCQESSYYVTFLVFEYFLLFEWKAVCRSVWKFVCKAQILLGQSESGYDDVIDSNRYYWHIIWWYFKISISVRRVELTSASARLPAISAKRSRADGRPRVKARPSKHTVRTALYWLLDTVVQNLRFCCHLSVFSQKKFMCIKRNKRFIKYVWIVFEFVARRPRKQ